MQMKTSQWLRIAAVLLTTGALFVGYAGYRLSRHQTPPVPSVSPGPTAHAPDHQGLPVVFAAQRIEPGRPITAADVTVAAVPVRPPTGFSALDQVIGKIPTGPIDPGQPLLAGQFTAGGPMARLLKPHQRAVAIKVDGVIGGGGFIFPGDYVDILAYVRGGQDRMPASAARVILSHVRVLAYGPDLAATPASAPIGHRNTPDDTQRNRTAVLAVPARYTTRLMLASNIGTLRLALYGASPAAGAEATTGAPLLVTTNELFPRNGRTASGGNTPRRSSSRVILYRGDKAQVLHSVPRTSR